MDSVHANRWLLEQNVTNVHLQHLVYRDIMLRGAQNASVSVDHNSVRKASIVGD